MPDEPRSGSNPLESLWAHAIEGLADSAVTAQHRAWLRLTRPLGLVEDTALLAAPNEFAKDVLETRLRMLISTALSRELGREIRVAVTVEPQPVAEPAASGGSRAAIRPEPAPAARTCPSPPRSRHGVARTAGHRCVPNQPG